MNNIGVIIIVVIYCHLMYRFPFFIGDDVELENMVNHFNEKKKYILTINILIH
jgi:hypothetical protein